MARPTVPRALRKARVVSISERGYGAALIGDIEAAKGRFVIMGDVDDSYDFSQLDGFLAKLREGYDLSYAKPVQRLDRAGGHARAPSLAGQSSPEFHRPYLFSRQS
jgi:hypothetical protein